MAVFRGSPGAPASSGLYPPRIACFVCGAEVPSDYPLYPLPPNGNGNNQVTTPFFPFLLTLEPPIGCRPPTPGGVAKSCRNCYSTLMRQWDEYEKGGVPTDRRYGYYVKRVEGLPFPTAEAQARLTNNRKRPGLSGHVMPAPASIPPGGTGFEPQSYAHGQVMQGHQQDQRGVVDLGRLKTASPLLSVATNPSVQRLGGSTSPMSGTPVPLPHSSPSSSQWSRRPLPAQSASSAPSSLFQLSSDRGESSLVNVSETDSGALDLSSGSRDRENMKSRSSVASHISHHSSSYQSEGTSAASSSSTNLMTGSSATGTGSGSVAEIVDLTLPDKNAVFEVCYVCGDDFKRGSLAFTFVKHVTPTEPFYPSLTNHPRPSRSRPIDSAGRVQTCDDCHEHLLAQWYSFETEETSHTDRHYTLRKRQVPAVDQTTFICYNCALEYHSASLRLLWVKPNSENEPYYPSLSQKKAPPGSSPISPQGMIQVCTNCYKDTKTKHHGFLKADHPPPKKRRVNSHGPFSLPRDPAEYFDPAGNPAGTHPEGGLGPAQEEEKVAPADVTCPLCRRKFCKFSFKVLHCQPHAGSSYFPFLSDLPMPEDYSELEDDKNMRVRACQACTTSLINQWSIYQRDQVPVEDRSYVYESPLGPRSFTGGGGRPHTPSSLRSHKSSRSADPDKLSRPPRSHSNQLPLEASNINKQVASVMAAASRPRSDTQSPKVAPPQQSSPSISLTSVAGVSLPNSITGSGDPAGITPIVPSALAASQAASLAAAAAPPAVGGAGPTPRSSTERGSGLTGQVQTSSILSTSANISSSNIENPSDTRGGGDANIGANLADRNKPPATNSSSFYCFLCGLHSELSFSRMLYSCAPGKKAPYFPFMKKHVPKNRAETLRDDGTALVCTFCYHSVMVQWSRYNEAKTPMSHVDPSERTYNLHEYRCYVCGIGTYRKRIRALRVMDFPFLRHHKPRKGVITMENGEMVAVCLDCFDNLRGQFIEAGKYGIPVEKRQYNWMQIPPPPESESSQLITPQERLSKFVRPPALLGLPGPGPNPNNTGAGVVGLAQVASAAGLLQPPPTVAIVTETQTSMIKPSVTSAMSSLQPPGSLGGGAAAAGIGSSGGHSHGVGSLHAQTLVSEAAASVTTSAAATAEKLKSES